MTLKLLADDDWIRMGDEILVLGDPTTYVPIVTIEELVADTLNWFDEDGLCIGSKSNPEHVAAWQRWNEKMKGGETGENTQGQGPTLD